MTQSKRIHLSGYSQASSDRPAAASGFHGQHPPGNIQELDPNHSTSWTQNKHLVAVVEFYDWQNINNTPRTLGFFICDTPILSSNSSFHFHSLLDDTGESKVCDLPWKKRVFFLLPNSRCKKKKNQALTWILSGSWPKSKQLVGVRVYIYI